MTLFALERFGGGSGRPRFRVNGIASMETDVPQLFQFSVPQRLQPIEAWWDSIAAAPESLPLPDWQKEELARRKLFSMNT
jgi:hypothetical protein